MKKAHQRERELKIRSTCFPLQIVILEFHFVSIPEHSRIKCACVQYFHFNREFAYHRKPKHTPKEQNKSTFSLYCSYHELQHMHINSNLFAGMQKSQTNSTRSHSTTQTQYRMFNRDMVRDFFFKTRSGVCVCISNSNFDRHGFTI